MQGVTTLLFRLFEILVTPSNVVQCCSILGGQFESVWTLLNWTLTLLLLVSPIVDNKVFRGA